MAVLVPALLNETLAADGGAITNPGGSIHNDGETTMIQKGSNVAIFGGAPNFYTTDQVTWDKKTRVQINTQFGVNGYLNLWVKIVGTAVVDMKQYPMTQVFTQAEAEQNLDYFGTGGEVTRDVGENLILDANGYIVYVS